MENSSSVLPILFYPSFSSAYDPLPFPCTHTPLIPNLICPKHPSKFEDLCTKSRCQMKTRQKNVTSTLDLHCGSKALLSDHIIISKAIFQSLAGPLYQACDALDPPGAGDILLPWPSSVPGDFRYSTCLHTQPLSCALGLCIGIK